MRDLYCGSILFRDLCKERGVREVPQRKKTAMSTHASAADDGGLVLFHEGVRTQLEATGAVMAGMEELTQRTAAFKSLADNAEPKLRDAAGRAKRTFLPRSDPSGKAQGAGAGQLGEALASAAARLTGAHLARWSACRTRVDDAAHALAVAVAHLDPMASPSGFAETRDRVRDASESLERALNECTPTTGDATRSNDRVTATVKAASAAALAFGEHAAKAGGVVTALAPGGVVDRAVQSLVEYMRFLEAVLPHVTPPSAGAGSSNVGRGTGQDGQSAGASAGLDADLERQASDTLGKLQACADVARAASDMDDAVARLGTTEPGPSRSLSLASAVDEAKKSLSIFGEAKDGPDVHAAAQAVGWCRLAVARARMDGTDAARGARAVHSSLQDPLAWASTAVRGRAFPVAFASARDRGAATLATRADTISAWYANASAPLTHTKSAVDLLVADYNKLLRM